MSQQFLHNSFIFNDEIESSFLSKMYDNDLNYLEEVFKASLLEVNSTSAFIQSACEKNETKDLRQLVHRLKPTFGFVGMLQLQAAMQQLENECAVYKETPMPTKLISDVMAIVERGKLVIETEYNRLQKFNEKKT